MAERSVPHVVPQRDRFREGLVERECRGQGPGDLGHVQGVGETGDVVVAFGVEEDLRLVLEATERLGMNDPVPVPLERGSEWIGLLQPGSTTAGDGSSGGRAEALFFRFPNQAVTPDQSFHGPMMTDPQALALTVRLDVVVAGVARRTGFEPATFGSGGQRSIH